MQAKHTMNEARNQEVESCFPGGCWFEDREKAAGGGMKNVSLLHHVLLHVIRRTYMRTK